MKNTILGPILKWLFFSSFFQQIFVGFSLWEPCRVPGGKTEKSVGPPLEFLTWISSHWPPVSCSLCFSVLVLASQAISAAGLLPQWAETLFLCLRSLLDFRRVVDFSFCSALLLLWRWEGRLLNSFHAGLETRSPSFDHFKIDLSFYCWI